MGMESSAQKLNKPTGYSADFILPNLVALIEQYNQETAIGESYFLFNQDCFA